ncbi:MAG TPA: hypothetical protein VFW00_10935, partial [Rhodocyclaceae bacterium]|nr:hypothetical protein [Rhodocyclaceae bacterium]
ILPAVSKLKVRWHAGFYAPLLSLHVTLLLRVLAALTGSFYLRQDAALGNAATIALFLLTVFTGMIVACKPRREISARTHSSSNVEPHREAHRNA